MPVIRITAVKIYLLITATISAVCSFDFGSPVNEARHRLRSRRRIGRSPASTPTAAHTTPHLPSTERRSSDGEITATPRSTTTTADRSPVFIPHHPDPTIQERCCVSKETHEFQCSSLDMNSLPSAFKTMLETVQHILSYAYIEDALQSLGNLADLGSLVDEGRPKPPRLMAIGLDWHPSCVRPFLRTLLQFAGLDTRVICIKVSEQQEDSATRDGEVDILLCLKGSHWRPNATRCTTSDIIPICPLVVRDGSQDDLIGRLRGWLTEHFECLEENRIAQDSCKWPIPYFVVDGNLWSFGFAIRHGSSIELYNQMVGSMGWNNGVQKLVVVLRHVIQSTDTRYREWYYERP
ncbi:hypothetical protein E4T38_02143 [Aureobasidium subglaciale]|nr:hypothetical protein E4T38_02143 [Aureobasidium subglaciale]KAI5229067.1 hypothetical protein E4T40_01751 [Aureobasidium subglaciale]KAI5232656.1 hypothetical protein E4T41_01971 [Aureobasidium subglaciale]KAI5266130.1 hypothetical protein E4T46_01920 [Aureobasidium subglaciale]